MLTMASTYSTSMAGIFFTYRIDSCDSEMTSRAMISIVTIVIFLALVQFSPRFLFSIYFCRGWIKAFHTFFTFLPSYYFVFQFCRLLLFFSHSFIYYFFRLPLFMAGLVIIVSRLTFPCCFFFPFLIVVRVKQAYISPRSS